MKKLTRTMALLLIGGSTLFTSCVSEDISPEVENLRQAQVNYLNSKAEVEQAKAENQMALAARIQAETALIQIQVELQQAILQAQADAEIARMEAAIAQAEADVAAARQRAAEAEVALQEAIDRLASQVNEAAQEYLEMYQSTISQANNKLEEITSLEQDLLRFNAYVDANGNIVDFEGAAAEIEAQISEDKASIAALETTVARLEALNTDADSVEAELMEVMSELDALESELAAANLDFERYRVETYQVTQNAYFNANNYIAYISNLEESIADRETEVAEVQETINSLESQIAPFQAELDATEGEYLLALEEAETLLEAWIQARATFIAANINNNPGDEEYDNARVILDDAIAAFEAYAGTGYPSNPQYIRDTNTLTTYAGNSEFGMIISQYTNVLNNGTFVNLQDRLSNEYSYLDFLLTGFNGSDFAELGLEDLNANLTFQQNELDSIYAEMGVADFTELETLREGVIETYLAKLEVLNELSAEVSALSSLQSTLEDYLNGNPSQIEERIESLQSEIDSLSADVDDAEATLVNNEISAEEWAATIVRTQDRIDRLTVEYDALVELANNFLEQFYAVVED
ncbi:MAG: hypothetical protein R6V36_01120 [Psychroflexus sp.]